MRILTNICIIAIIIAFNACKNKTRNAHETLDTHVENIKKIKGKTIKFPDTVNSMINYSAKLNDIYTEKNIKIVSYTDGRCPACIKKLNGLNKIIKELDSIQGTDIDLISFVLIKNKKKFLRKFYPELDSLPLILVDNYRFLEKNEFPASGDYRTFLVNADNEIQLVGNPYQNKELKKLYTKKIKTIVDEAKNHTTKKTLEAKVIERTKAKFKEENKMVIEPVTRNGQNVGIYQFEHNKTRPMAIGKNNEIHFSLLNSESNKEPVILKVRNKTEETKREIKSKLDEITYFSLQPDTTTEYSFKAYFNNKKGEAVLFHYFVR